LNRAVGKKLPRGFVWPDVWDASQTTGGPAEIAPPIQLPTLKECILGRLGKPFLPPDKNDGGKQAAAVLNK
jgi:hypothetical protein